LHNFAHAAAAVAMAKYVSTFMEPGLRVAPSSVSMNTKDSFMRFVVVGSILAVGLLAICVSMNS
jgi:hypothetical protein